MISAEVPKNELDRLKVLNDYNILDTEPEENFDEITQLATEICQTPISLISLIDPDRQWFKSHHGLTQTQTPRQYAFCAHAINNPTEILEVRDARLDERFADNPLVKEDPNIVFYTGVPLVSPQGFAMGTLCVIDHQPKKLNATQLHSLKVLANQVIKLFELRKTNRKLRETYKKLILTNDELKQLNRLASHDLREPLRMISGFIGLLKRDYSSKLDQEANSYIDIALDGSKRMNQLILDVLDRSSLEKTLSEKDLVDLNELLELVKQNLSIQIEETKATIQVTSSLPTISGSRTEMTRLFQNLINNAIKFKSANRKPTIKIACTARNDHWYFTISDNGIGIGVDDHKNIFGMFSRLPHTSTISGTGLGLAICEKIVSQLGGEIWVTSELDKGSIFHFTLPMTTE